jgi:hypothetical protein
VILYVARRYLHLSREEWDNLGWDIQRVYLEGMTADESVPLTFQEAPAGGTSGFGAQERRVEVESPVNIADMISELESARAK